MKSLILMILLYSTTTLAGDSWINRLKDIIFFWEDDYEISWCDGSEIKKEPLNVKIDIKNKTLKFSIDDLHWDEGSPRILSLFHATNSLYLMDSHLSKNKTCIVVSGDDITSKLQNISYLQYDFNFANDSVLQFQATQGDQRMEVRHISEQKLSRIVSIEGIREMNSIVYIDAKGKQSTTKTLDLTNSNYRFYTLNLRYFKKSNIKISSPEEFIDTLYKLNDLSIKLKDILIQEQDTLDIGHNKDFIEIFQIAGKLMSSDGMVANKNIISRAVAMLPFGTSTTILQNSIEFLDRFVTKVRNSTIISTNPDLDVSAAIKKFGPIIFNIALNLEPDFEALCRTNYHIELPFDKGITGSIADLFLALITRSGNYIAQSDYSSALDFLEFVNQLGSIGSTYQQIVNDPIQKQRIAEMYSRMRKSLAGIPSLSLAQSELERMNIFIDELKYKRIKKEYFVNISNQLTKNEHEIYLELHSQLKKLQNADSSIAFVPEQAIAKAKQLHQHSQDLLKELKIKQKSLVELSSYLKNVETSGGTFVRRLCL